MRPLCCVFARTLRVTLLPLCSLFIVRATFRYMHVSTSVLQFHVHLHPMCDAALCAVFIPPLFGASCHVTAYAYTLLQHRAPCYNLRQIFHTHTYSKSVKRFLTIEAAAERQQQEHLRSTVVVTEGDLPNVPHLCARSILVWWQWLRPSAVLRSHNILPALFCFFTKEDINSRERKVSSVKKLGKKEAS